MLIGESESANRGSGRPVAEPALIGDQAGCDRVRRGPDLLPGIKSLAGQLAGATAAAPVKAAA